jgi:Sec23/Sec24 zinc finger protein
VLSLRFICALTTATPPWRIPACTALTLQATHDAGLVPLTARAVKAALRRVPAGARACVIGFGSVVEFVTLGRDGRRPARLVLPDNTDPFLPSPANHLMGMPTCGCHLTEPFPCFPLPLML